MKKFELKFWLSCVMMALCIGFTACSDDDDDKKEAVAGTYTGTITVTDKDMRYTKVRKKNGTRPIPKMCTPLRTTVAEHTKMYQEALPIRRTSPGAFPETNLKSLSTVIAMKLPSKL